MKTVHNIAYDFTSDPLLRVKVTGRHSCFWWHQPNIQKDSIPHVRKDPKHCNVHLAELS